MIEIKIQDLYKKIIKHYSSKKRFVLFKRPNENKIYFYSSTNKNVGSINQDNFFLISSFNQTSIIKIYTKQIFFINIENNNNKNNNKNNKNNNKNDFCLLKHSYKYNKLIAQAIKLINIGLLNKIVLSKFLEIDCNNLLLRKTFQNFIVSYPNTFVVLWYNMNYEFWISATPELLITYEIGKKQLTTVALAGTITQDNSNQMMYDWTNKEFEEHQIVIEYIKNILQNKYAGYISIDKTKTIQVGSLFHLKTIIKFVFYKKINIFKLLNTIYPTPSICGSPKEPALDFITKYEGYNRQFYTGYFGPVSKNNIELYLNLRCANINLKNNKIIIYAGSGITAKSNIFLEYLETDSKIKNIVSNLIFK
ncbi:chorismate-binding protein [Blattabacterium cuenoti]|uniref:chorismate-binding protein n=1 Tax=Blattabacterium cuenoti TaxID=1653831 RepID=UPI00163B8033|nr:chorismate-binding protein [Blattabacterium cuenoti]